MSYYAKQDWFSDPEIVQGMLRVASGRFELNWMKARTERVRAVPSNPKRGLTLEDVNVGSYAHERLPDLIRTNFSMAPRGCELLPGLPSLGYQVNRKSDVWSDLASSLFEEAKARRWVPARDVPWGLLEEGGGLSKVESRSHAQLCTGLAAMALCMGDVAARWVWLINHEFLEIVYYLCTQMLDAARLSEVFRKRVLAGGAGLGRDSRELEEFLKGVFDSDTYPLASCSANLVLMGLVQMLCRHLGSRARNAADLVVFSRATQDASRFLAYGVSHLKQRLVTRPHEAAAVDDHLRETENLLVGTLGSPELLEPLLILETGVPEQAAEATPRVAKLYARLAEEHFQRLEAAGLGDRRKTSPLAELPALLSAEA
jgi:hypothetical protein